MDDEPNPWLTYEARKADLQALRLTPSEYDAAHRTLCDELGI